jgi:glycosyltransferase involved in cell wall biosynthesis
MTATLGTASAEASVSRAAMRLLFVCDQYPPFDRGGYAQLCHDLAHGLRRRGHHVTVLCAASDARERAPESEPVVRGLQIPIRYEDRWPIPVQQVVLAAPRRRRSLRVFERVLAETRAEAVLFWPHEYVDRHLMLAAERRPDLAVGYYTAGYSPTQPSILAEYWAHPGRSRRARLIKSLLQPLLGNRDRRHDALARKHVVCVSEYERQRVLGEGIAAENVVVTYNGIDPYQFAFLGPPSTRRQTSTPLSVLYVGRLSETKGAHTAIEALKVLHERRPDLPVRLTLLGTGPEAYLRELDRRKRAYGLDDVVERRAWIPREDVPDFMSRFHVLVLPTIHPEPLARAVQEAMAMGLVVVATPTGGTPEVVRDGETGLTFAPDDAAELVERLSLVHYDLPLCDRLAEAARRLVESQFTIEAMACSMEAHIRCWLHARRDTGHVPPALIPSGRREAARLAPAPRP